MKTIALIACLSLSAFGAETTTKNDTITMDRKEFDALVEDTIKSRKGSSTENRSDKKIALTAGLGGYSFMEALSFQVGFFLSKDDILQLRYTLGDDGDDYYFDSTNTDMEVISLSYKKFLGNSFYLQPGIAFHNVETNNRSRFSGLSSKDQYLYGSLDIGNEWQWKNFTLGVSWVGLNVGFMELGDSAFRGYEGQQRVTMNLLNLMLGASF